MTNNKKDEFDEKQDSNDLTDKEIEEITKALDRMKGKGIVPEKDIIINKFGINIPVGLGL